jgi:SAM-dependent methyltransferase
VAEKGLNNCIYTQGDMRKAASIYRGRSFDAVLNIFSSLGYWDDETDLKILKQFRILTRKGGYLIIDHANRDSLVRHFNSVGFVDFGEVVRNEARTLNQETGRMEVKWTYYRKKGNDLIHIKTISFDHRLYSIHEFKEQLTNAGWTLKAYYSGFDKTPYNWDRNRLVLVAENPS